MALSPLPSPKKTSLHSSSKLKQKRELEFKKKNKYLTKKLTRPVCRARKVKKIDSLCSSLPKEEEENALQIVKCNEQKVDKNPLALQRAHEVQDNLGRNLPSFAKLMLRSHVTKGFWLGLPRPFCVENLPKHDETIVLVGENDEEYDTKYLAGKTGLSGGWAGFSLAHNLLEGDALVFQLIQKWKFKVFIVRASGLTEINGAISLLNLHVEPKPIEEEEESIREALMQENVESPSSCSDQAYSNKNPENLGVDILNKITYLEPVVDFKAVKTFKAFSILADGLPVDSEIDEHTRMKYYELCRSQQCYLHKRLIPCLNLKLVAGIISETVTVSDAIRSANLTTPLGYLETWDNTLKYVEDLGMAVGFLRERLKKLKNIPYEVKQKVEMKKCERTSLEKELASLKLKQLDTERAMRIVDDQMEALKAEDEKLALTFKVAASAPW